jgi:hypothetical protein
VYNNKISDRDGDGEHLVTGDPPAFNIWFAHNSFSGSLATWSTATSNPATMNQKWVNNIFSMAGFNRLIMENSYGRLEGDLAVVPAWGYNAHHGSFSFANPPAWYDEGNITLSSSIWPITTSEPDFVLPAGHPCRNTGINVSQPFTIRGTQYPALPGFPTGYFSGAAPHMGAWQEPAGGPISEPATMTSPVNGSTFTGSTTTFTWSTGQLVTEYWLDVGTSFAGTQIYTESQGSNLSKLITGIPTTGIAIYVRLWSKISGLWQSLDYQYTAFTTVTPAPEWPAIAPGPPSASGLRLFIIQKST